MSPENVRMCGEAVQKKQKDKEIFMAATEKKVQIFK
jgi:hypothetical protein